MDLLTDERVFDDDLHDVSVIGDNGIAQNGAADFTIAADRDMRANDRVFDMSRGLNIDGGMMATPGRSTPSVLL